MKHAHGIILAAALGGILVGAIRLHDANSASPIGESGFVKLKAGMSEAEVSRVLGKPAGDYSTGVLLADLPSHDFPKDINPVDFAELIVAFRNTWDGFGPQKGVAKEWISDNGIITVHFDEKGIALATDFLRVQRKPENNIQVLKRLFGL